MKRFAPILTLLAALAVLVGGPACSQLRGAPVPGTLLGQRYPLTWPQGLFFPLVVSLPLTGRTGVEDNITSIPKLGGGTLATYPLVPAFNLPTGCGGASITKWATAGGEISGAANSGANIVMYLFGYGGANNNSWPESFGCDLGELQSASFSNVDVIGAGPPPISGAGYPGVNTLDNTKPNSVASMLALASVTGLQSTLIGYQMNDEPHCQSSENHPFMADQIPGYLNITFWDPTRMVFSNETKWMQNPGTYNSVPPNPPKVSAPGDFFHNGTILANGSSWTDVGGTACIFIAGIQQPGAVNPLSLQSSAAASFDSYTQINAGNGSSTTYLFQSGSDWAQYPSDKIFLQMLTLWSMGQFKNPSQPSWAYLESANTAMASGNVTLFNATLTPGSTLITINQPGAVLQPYFGPAGTVGGCIQGTPNCSIWLGLGFSDYPAIVELPPQATGCLGVVAHAVIAAGSVTSVVVDNGGSGCNGSGAPLVSFVAIGSGGGAAATAVVSGSSVSAINLNTTSTTGQAYDSATGNVTLTFAAGPGLSVGNNIAVQSAAGTGSFASINGTFTVTAVVNTTSPALHTVTYQIASGLTMTLSAATMIKEGNNYTSGKSCILPGTTLVAVTTASGAAGQYTSGTLSQATSNTGACASPVTENMRISFNPDGVEDVQTAVYSGCRYSLAEYQFAMCAPGGNMFRTWGQQLTAEALGQVIAGATGIEWFMQEDYSGAWGIGGNSQSRFPGVDAATQAAADISLSAVQYVNTTICGANPLACGSSGGLAPQILSPQLGQCTMDTLSNLVTNTERVTQTCGHGILTLASASATYPFEGLVTNYHGVAYVFLMPLRCSWSSCHDTWGSNVGGQPVTVTLTGYSTQHATVVYDSNCKWDPAHCLVGTPPIALSGGAFTTPTIGANNDAYEVVVYAVQ